MNREPFVATPFLREIGRGKKGARGISRDDARALYAAMLEGRVSDLELGGLMLAMRFKGESVDEIAGFQEAAEASLALLPSPPGEFAPVLIPTYNGARKMANLTPLLAFLLARRGVPVLVHGVSEDPGRVTTAEILAQMGVGPSASATEMAAAFAQGRPAFMPIATLAPAMARLLALRQILGVRNSTHTLVKILQPFQGPALRLVSYTHPEYFTMLTDYFADAAPRDRGDAFLMRGTEGETVANARRGQQIDWFHGGERTVLVEREPPNDELVDLPDGRDAATTARWIGQALDGQRPVPGPIAEQVEQCIEASRALRMH